MKEELQVSRKKLKYPRGFTLIETVISILLFTLMGLACAGMISFFAKYTRDDSVKTCLLQAASSGIEAKRADPTISSIANFTCGGYTASVAITSAGTLPTTAPTMGSGQSACVQITSTATIGTKTRILRDFICNFQ